MYVSMHIPIHAHVHIHIGMCTWDHPRIRVGVHARVSARRRCTCTPRSVCAHEGMYVCEREDCHGHFCSGWLPNCLRQR